MFQALTRFWIPLLSIIVIAVGSFAVLRIRGTFAGDAPRAPTAASSDDIAPFNPKNVSYELTGSAGGTVDVDYLDENGQPHSVVDAPLPWTLTIVTTLPSMSANLVAQADTATSTLRCRVLVDDEVRDDRTSNDYKPFIYCLVKAV